MSLVHVVPKKLSKPDLSIYYFKGGYCRIVIVKKIIESLNFMEGLSHNRVNVFYDNDNKFFVIKPVLLKEELETSYKISLVKNDSNTYYTQFNTSEIMGEEKLKLSSYEVKKNTLYLQLKGENNVKTKEK